MHFKNYYDNEEPFINENNTKHCIFDYVHYYEKNGDHIIEVKEKKAEIGVIVCGSGNGAAMTANKHKGIRAAICWSEEIAALAKQHNKANIISIPSRFLKEEEILSIIDVFIKEGFEGGRHERRIKKIDQND